MTDDLSKTYKIWCDGSYRHFGRKAGAGVVIQDPEGNITEEAVVLPSPDKDTHRFGSFYAELQACAHALEKIPEGACVELHMDCKDVLLALRGNALKRGEINSIRDTFNRASEAKKRFESVNLNYLSDKNYHMGRAHRLSRAASAEPRNKSENSYVLKNFKLD